MSESRRARLIAYGLALLAPAVTLLVRWPLEAALGDRVLYMVFIPAILVVAYVGGLWPGLVATVLSALAANYFLVSPFRSFAVTSAPNAAALSLLLLIGAIISVLSESLHRSWRRLLAHERRRSEEALREAEDRFRQMAENVHEIFWMMDARHEKFLYISPTYAEVWGRTCQSLYEQPSSWIDGVHPDDRTGALKNVEQRQAGIFTDLEFRIVRSDGSVRWIRSRAFPMPDAEGKDSRIAGVAEDITERKEAAESLRKSEQRFRTFVDHATDAFFLQDHDYVILDVNRQACDSLGYTRDELIGMTPADFDPNFTTAVMEDLTRRLDAGKLMAFESSHRRNDGTIFPVEIRGQAFNEGGRRFAVAMVRDITERKQAEEALRESEQRWRSLTETLPQLVWTATPDGACDYFSTQWTQHTGVPEDRLLGWQWMETLHPDDREPTRTFWTNSVAGRGAYDVEYRVRRTDGEYRWFKTRGVPIRDSAGRTVKWFGTCTDITDARLAAEELRLAKEAAESANRAKDEFLANVSHEIRTPMNAILGMTELVLGTPMSGDQRQSLRIVKAAADNLLSILNDLLDFSKIEAGKMELDPADFGLRAALGDTLRTLDMRARNAGLDLVSHVDADVPDALVGDAGRLRQVLLNLIGNAVKFTKEGEVVVRAEVAGGTTPDRVAVRFSVSDTGIGIPPDKQEKIFRAFEQEDTSTTRKYGGTGLGLTIASRLVALMGGTITVDSEPGRGSVFAFTVQFARRDEGGEQRDEGEGMRDERKPDLSPVDSALVLPPLSLIPHPSSLHILVAEDNDFNSQVLEQLLVRRGHRVQLANDGRKALSLAQDSKFDLLLLDVHMPELDGFQVIEAIRERERSVGGHLPVVALTARSRKEDRDRCLAAGMDDFLSKPIQAPDLWAAIDRVVKKREEGRGRRDESVACPQFHLLDPRVLLAACGGDPVILANICQAFRTRLPDQLTAIRDALTDRDAPRLREAAHKVCGMVAAFSTLAGGVASDIEDLAAQGQLEDSRPLAAKLDEMSGALMRVVDGLSIERLQPQV
jgi:PAS domain S-box-containing protein